MDAISCSQEAIAGEGTHGAHGHSSRLSPVFIRDNPWELEFASHLAPVRRGCHAPSQGVVCVYASPACVCVPLPLHRSIIDLGWGGCVTVSVWVFLP